MFPAETHTLTERSGNPPSDCRIVAHPDGTLTPETDENVKHALERHGTPHAYRKPENTIVRQPVDAPRSRIAASGTPRTAYPRESFCSRRPRAAWRVAFGQNIGESPTRRANAPDITSNHRTASGLRIHMGAIRPPRPGPAFCRTKRSEWNPGHGCSPTSQAAARRPEGDSRLRAAMPAPAHHGSPAEAPLGGTCRTLDPACQNESTTATPVPAPSRPCLPWEEDRGQVPDIPEMVPGRGQLPSGAEDVRVTAIGKDTPILPDPEQSRQMRRLPVCSRIVVWLPFSLEPVR